MVTEPHELGHGPLWSLTHSQNHRLTQAWVRKVGSEFHIHCIAGSKLQGVINRQPSKGQTLHTELQTYYLTHC